MEKRIICGIYKITSPTGKIYIGQSTDIKKRKSVYAKCTCQKQRKLFNSIKKYGWKRHVFEIICICQQSELNDLEIFYSKLYNSLCPINGLNLRDCGGSKGKHTVESIILMKVNHWSKTSRGKDISKKIGDKNRGKSTYRKGIPLSESHKKRISLAHKGVKRSPLKESTKKKMSISITGTKKSQSAKDKISVSNKLAYSSSEIREKLRVLNTGRIMTEEARKNMSNARKKLYKNGFINPMKGKKASEETKKKLRESHLGIKQSAETIAKRVAKTKGVKRSPEQIERIRQGRIKTGGWKYYGPKNKQ